MPWRRYGQTRHRGGWLALAKLLGGFILGLVLGAVGAASELVMYALLAVVACLAAGALWLEFRGEMMRSERVLSTTLLLSCGVILGMELIR